MSKILLGMSGGIDSSVAAWILKRDAHDVVGVTFHFHDSPQCAAAIERAIECAKLLGIEHHVIDMRDEFAHKVKMPTAAQFAQGYFPNPCTTCTHELKMPALFEQADYFGCEYVATGHYARVTKDTDGYKLKPYQLRKPLDVSKDQTYLLYTLSQEQLARLIFPLADIHKGAVRQMAMRAGLMRIAPVNDGQGEACFYGGVQHTKWLEGEGELSPKPGSIIYIGDNSQLGAYQRQYVYAPDDSLGFFDIELTVVDDGDESTNNDETCESSDQTTTAHEELFVLYKDVDKHEILVGTRAVAGTEMCMLRDVFWTSIEPVQEKRSCRARIAYNRKPLPAQIICKKDGVIVVFNERVGGVCSGQPIVFYSDDLVLGGGIVVG